jgi:hypothetical protein
MDTVQTFFLYAVITILMTPLLLVYGIPFILLARVFNQHAKPLLKDSTRFYAACGIAALGIAPAYDRYRAPLPIYTWLVEGNSPGLGYMVLSFLVTWLVVVVQTRHLMHALGRKQPSKPTP